MTDRLTKVRQFWNTTPCDGHHTYLQRSQFRYRKDPYLPSILARVAARHRHILEVGCGQGTDAVTLCRALPEDGRYYGIDLSDVSVRSARDAATATRSTLSVQPHFAVADAEHLPLPDNAVECILSVGALHHTPDTAAAIREVRRVLVPDGTLYVFLYRRRSPKLLAAHAVRGVQRGLDALVRGDRVLYNLVRRMRPPERRLGTALYEGLGVPILRSYTRSHLTALFRDFKSVTLATFGYVWLVTAAK